jgi:hypothetical protein
MTTPISFPPPPAPRVLSFAKPGDCVSITNNVGAIDPMVVMSFCGRREAFYCVSCQLFLGNVGQLEMHAESGGTHVFVRWCGRHGVPEGPEPIDIDRLKHFEQLESGL